MQHPRSSRIENSNDLVRLRVDDDDLVGDQEELISPPMRLNLHELRRDRIEVNIVRYPAADRNREVDVRCRLSWAALPLASTTARRRTAMIAAAQTVLINYGAPSVINFVQTTVGQRENPCWN